MAAEPEVIRAIEAAVSEEPGNAALRVHLADLLVDAGRPRDALAQLEVVLAAEPDHVRALGLAASVGKALGDGRAPGWSRLHGSLNPTAKADSPDRAPAPAPTAGDPQTGVPVNDLESERTDWDGLLREVLNDDGNRELVTLADVGGLVEVKDRLRQSFLDPMRNPELRRAYGAHLRGGLLLWGPPGCGKTFLARAVAGELGARFVSVGLHQVLDMWLGNSEKEMHEVFEVARRNAPCVLFFDELDAIGHSRMSLGRSAARNVVAQLLVELDGVDASNEGIFVIGATNQPWDVDPALRRPGRFDRTVLLLPPDTEARAAIFRYHLRDRPIGSVDFDGLARGTEGMSGADIRLICEEAAQRALGEAIRTSTVQPISTGLLRDAIGTIRPSTTAWFESARNHIRYANSAGEYDELASYMRHRRSR